MKKIIFTLTNLVFCFALASCSLFGGGEKDVEPTEPSNESTDYYEAGAVDGANAPGNDGEEDDENEGDEFAEKSNTATLEDTSDSSVDTDVAFGEPRDIPEDNLTPDTTPDVEPEAEPAPAPRPAKSIASTNFKQGMYDFDEDCAMHSDPDAKSAVSGNIKAPKKLWVEPFDGQWLRVYKKSGPAYISKSCLVK